MKLIKLALGMSLIMTCVVAGHAWQTRMELNTRLCIAAFEGDREGVISLLQQGADVDGTTNNRTLVDRSTYHPVIEVCGNWNRFQCPRPAILAAREGHIGIVETLLSNGSKCTLSEFAKYYDFIPDDRYEKENLQKTLLVLRHEKGAKSIR